MMQSDTSHLFYHKDHLTQDSFLWGCDPMRVRSSPFFRFLDHTKQRTAVGGTPLDEWSARRTDTYLTTHNTHNKHTSMSPAGFEPKISAGERPQTYTWDRAASGTDKEHNIECV